MENKVNKPLTKLERFICKVSMAVIIPELIVSCSMLAGDCAKDYSYMMESYQTSEISQRERMADREKQEAPERSSIATLVNKGKILSAFDVNGDHETDYMARFGNSVYYYVFDKQSHWNEDAACYKRMTPDQNEQ
ncbi:MAG: hypothetical protein V1743_08070 [Nanoarchaeota archaeon]